MAAASLIAFVLLAIALCVVVVRQNRRYRRLRERFLRLERRTDELLQVIKPVYTARVATQLAGAGIPAARMPPIFRSQFGEDLFLYELFNADPAEPKTEGFYIECGAYDGSTYSVTSVFDALGWDGLLVEPIPELAEAARKARPNARVVQAALSVRGSTGTARFIHLTGRQTHDAASSFLGDGGGGARSRAASGERARRVEVPLTTMDAVLEAQPPKSRVDLAVIDVEGAELSLLDGFDLARWGPRVILIEDHSMGHDASLLEHLRERGYEHITWISYNRLMIRQEESALIARARDLTQHTAVDRVRG